MAIAVRIIYAEIKKTISDFKVAYCVYVTLSRTEDTVAGITQAWEDVVLIVQVIIEGC